MSPRVHETRRSRHVEPDDDPEARCTECGRTYNPYRHGLNCPSCDGEEAGK